MTTQPTARALHGVKEQGHLGSSLRPNHAQSFTLPSAWASSIPPLVRPRLPVALLHCGAKISQKAALLVATPNISFSSNLLLLSHLVFHQLFFPYNHLLLPILELFIDYIDDVYSV